MTKTKTCDKCSHSYDFSLKKCPHCNSTSVRPPYVIDSKWIKPTFKVRVQKRVSSPEDLIIQIRKNYKLANQEEVTADKININTPEEWDKIQEFINSHLVGTVGWRKPEEHIKKIREKVEGEEQIQKEAFELVSQYPETLLQFLNSFNIEDIEKYDWDFSSKLMNTVNSLTFSNEERLKASFIDFVKKLSKQGEKGIRKGMDELSDLMDTWTLFQITSVSSILQSRLITLEMFEEMIHTDETYELKGKNSIHGILERSLWMINEEYWLIQSNKSLKTFIGDELSKKDKKYEKKRPDFVCASWGNQLIIAEIKRPSHTINKGDLNQIMDYIVIAKKYKSEKFSSVNGYLIGNKFTPDLRTRAGMVRGIKLKTYNDLVDNARTRYQEYLMALEKNV